MNQSKLVKVNNEKSFKYQGKNISKKKYTKKKGKIVSSANKGGADGTAEEDKTPKTKNEIINSLIETLELDVKIDLLPGEELSQDYFGNPEIIHKNQQTMMKRIQEEKREFFILTDLLKDKLNMEIWEVIILKNENLISIPQIMDKFNELRNDETKYVIDLHDFQDNFIQLILLINFIGKQYFTELKGLELVVNIFDKIQDYIAVGSKIFKNFWIIMRTLELIMNIINIKIMIKTIEFLEGDLDTLLKVGEQQKLDKEFYEGKTTDVLNYIGTKYQIDYKRHLVYTLEGVESTFLAELTSARNIYQMDYSYPSLNKGIRKNKFSLYQSTGTSYSAQQQGLISPFIGLCLDKVSSTDKKKTNMKNFYKVIMDIANKLFPDLYEDNKTVTPAGKTINKVTYDSDSWKEMYKKDKINYYWIIKYSKSLSYNKSDRILSMVKTYQDWENEKEVYEFLGAEYIGLHEKIENYKRLDNGLHLEMLDIEKPLKIVEYTKPGMEKQDPRILKDLFHNRFFSNKKLFSLRNMKQNIVDKKTIYYQEVNKAIGSENIFNKNLYDLGLDANDEKIRLKIMAYLFDLLYYYNSRIEADPTQVFADLDNILLIRGDHHESLTESINFTPPFASTINLDELSSYLDYLIELAKDIIGDIIARNSKVENIKHTVFYNFVTLPFKNEIYKPKSTTGAAS